MNDFEAEVERIAKDVFPQDSEGYLVSIEITTGDGSALPDPYRFFESVTSYSNNAKETMQFITSLHYGNSLAYKECLECFRDSVKHRAWKDVELFATDLARYELIENMLEAAIEYMETRLD